MLSTPSATVLTNALMLGPSALGVALRTPDFKRQIGEADLRQSYDFLRRLTWHLPLTRPQVSKLLGALDSPQDLDSLSGIAEILETLDPETYFEASGQAALELGLTTYLDPSVEMRTLSQRVNDTSQATLLQDFNLSSLADTDKSATYEVRSQDAELGTTSLFKEHLPAPLRNIYEGKFIFNFIRRPSTNLTQILQRQAVIEALIHSSELTALRDLKNRSYKLQKGIELLFRTRIEIREGHEMTLIEAYRRGYKSEVSSSIASALGEIQTGLRDYSQMIEQLADSQNPFLKKIAADLSFSLETTQQWTEDYILSHDRNHDDEILSWTSRIIQKITQLALFIEYAILVTKDDYQKARFDPEDPLQYRQGWHFSRSKLGGPTHQSWEKPEKPQVLNDSPADHTTTIFSGSNMSGKSFQLKTLFYMQLLAQSFGYVPCAEGNFGIYDSFHYLDRASTDHHAHLSAFGREISDWSETIRQFGQKPFLCCDEGFSTTSPTDQYRLLAGIDQSLRPRHAHVFYATHNEYFIRRYASDPKTGVYHLETKVGEGRKVDYLHRLQEGYGDSMALVVAEDLGLPLPVIERARAYYEGREVALPPPRSLPPPVPNSGSSRTREKAVSPHQWIPDDRNGNSPFHLFSEDRDFNIGWSLDLPNTGDRDEDLNSLGSLVATRRHHVLKFLTNGPAPQGPEALEWQHTFASLAAEDYYAEVTELEPRLLHLILHFNALAHSAHLLLSFNKALFPFDHEHYFIYHSGFLKNEEKDVLLTYLEMHRKILGADFPFEAELGELRRLDEVNKKMEAATQQWTLQDILDFRTSENKRGGVLPQTDSIRAILNRIYGYLKEENKSLQDLTCDDMDRLHERFRQKSDQETHPTPEFKKLISRMARLAEGFRELLPHIAPREDPNRVTWHMTQRALIDKLDELCHLYKKLPNLSLFEVDLDSIREELAQIVKFKMSHVTRQDIHWDGFMALPPEKKFAFALPFLIAPTDVVSDFLALLRRIDSVPLHQMANDLEEQFSEFLQDDESERYERSSPLISGPALLQRLRAIYQPFEEQFRQLGESPKKRGALETKFANEVWKNLRSHFRLDFHAGLGFYGPTHRTVFAAAVKKVSAFFLIGHTIRIQGQARVSFNETNEIHFEDAWSLFAPKNQQIISDVRFTPNERVKLINGANMSGKTFWLKKAAIGALWALRTGHAPAKSATMPLLDGIVYLDRVNSKSDQNLSAFGNEIEFWKRYLEILGAKNNVLVLSTLDEIFSTTSPAYQAALTFAIATESLARGQPSALATHNHDVIDRLIEAFPGQTAPYHFAGRIQPTPRGEIFVPSYQLQKGHVGSQAIEVARSLNFDPEILSLAETMDPPWVQLT